MFRKILSYEYKFNYIPGNIGHYEKNNNIRSSGQKIYLTKSLKKIFLT